MTFFEAIQSFLQHIPLNIFIWRATQQFFSYLPMYGKSVGHDPTRKSEPWINLSNDSQLDIGVSLSQIMFHEMVAIHSVYPKGATMEGLWNEQSSVPAFLPDKNEIINPDQVDMLGISGKFGQFLKAGGLVDLF